MKFKMDKLKGKIREEGFSQEKIADLLKISPSTFSLKINGLALFNQEELQSMAEILKIPGTQYEEYFFTINV